MIIWDFKLRLRVTSADAMPRAALLVKGTTFMKQGLALMVLFAVAAPAALAQNTAGQGTILSAFFGLDDSRRIRTRTFVTCGGSNGRDGMPVIFSKELNERTLDPKHFRITTASGKIGNVNCVTLRPADGEGKKRTVLVIGEYGTKVDQPVKVEIIGDLMSIDGRVNFKGARADVIPLEAGPTMILSEVVPREMWRLGAKGKCPVEGVKSVVRVTWTGGVTKPGSTEIDDKERQLYKVSVRAANGRLATVTPITVADLNDNDNNHELCIGAEGVSVSVFLPAAVLTYPNDDLNPDTEVKISSSGQ
ncbi:hypothetical protein MCEMSEM23_02793 [Rhabdaerophilaceae bacterium]